MAHSAPDPSFGTFALPRILKILRQASEHMPRQWMSSGIRRVISAAWSEPYDVDGFGNQKACLYPSDNWAERRVITGTQCFDAAERACLRDHVLDGSGAYVFVGAGANVGLYTFWARACAAEAGRPFRALAVEPDPVNKRRLAENLGANGADDVIHADVALSDTVGRISFPSAGLGDRGHAKVAEDGDLSVPAAPLLDVLKQAGLTRIDALKMDIEGQEIRVLGNFFDTAPVGLWPDMLIVEVKHAGSDLAGLLNRAGYQTSYSNSTNGVYRLSKRHTPGDAKDRTDV